MGKILARLPDRRAIIGVYATAAFLVYSWTLLASFWKVPSWLYFLKISEILSVYAYSLVINFGESMLLIFLALIAGFILPHRWWNAQFTSRGVIWISVLMGSIMLRLYTNRAPDYWEDFVYHQWAWWGWTILLAVVLDYLASRINLLRKGLENLADRLVVFLYIYLPLTAVSIIVVFVRIFF
jgi:hypothetical protein